MVEDKTDEGYDSLLRLAIRNHALVLENDDDKGNCSRLKCDV